MIWAWLHTIESRMAGRTSGRRADLLLRGTDQKNQTYTLEALVKSRLGLGLLIETGTNITIVVGKRHLCPRSECELVDFARASIILLSSLFSPASGVLETGRFHLVELHQDDLDLTSPTCSWYRSPARPALRTLTAGSASP